MLVTTSSPATAGVVFSVPTTWPLGVDLELLVGRGCPRSSDSYWYSRPDWPKASPAWYPWEARDRVRSC